MQMAVKPTAAYLKPLLTNRKCFYLAAVLSFAKSFPLWHSGTASGGTG